MIKNTAGQKVGAQMVSATDGSAFTGAVTVAVTGDAGTQATGSVGAGACTHEGTGYHTYAPAQAETNYDLVAFSFSGSGAVAVTVQIYTRAGDAFTRLGAPAGASVSADILVIDNFADELETRLSAARAGYLDNLSVGAVALEATAQAILTNTAVIGALGAGLTAVPWNAAWDTEVESEVLDALNTILADSIPADGTLPTVRQALYMLTQFMLERSVSGTTVTVRKADGSTALFTLTLSDATTPTSITRTT